MGQPLQSMTGYARASGESAGVGFSVEIKSVNGRGLDLRMRIQPGYDGLEPELRRRLGKVLTRGSVSLGISVERTAEAGDVIVNEQALATVMEAVRRISSEIGTPLPSADGILAIKGVIEQRETAPDDDARADLEAAILGAADRAIDELVETRRREGAELAAVLAGRLDEIERLTASAEAHPSRTRDAVLARLSEQVGQVQEVAAGLSEERLMQEALLLWTKNDIREELDRLAAHIIAARALIAGGGAVGRKLDFLSQEFNREANTLCSKSNAVELTAIGLDLKAVIDQFREQIQNIE